MTAQSADRDPGLRSGGAVPEYFPVDLPVAASVVCYVGALAAVDTSGNARPGRTSASDKILGVFCKRVDNSAGLAGAKRTQGIRRGVFSFKNAAVDALGAAHIGGDAYVHDDQTFGATSNTGARVKGGTFVGLDPDISGNVLVQVG
jgi:hypothetical protein